jgi:8-oxo-dGTP pyrophosphatase MutT (NUDIX family)
MIPGGGVKKRETFAVGAARELQEETSITTKLTYFYEYTQVQEYKHDTVQCFYGYVTKAEVSIDNFEIVTYGWFSPNNLPVDCSPIVARILNQYQMTVI